MFEVQSLRFIVLFLGSSALTRAQIDTINNIPTIFEGKLEWATVRQPDCNSFEVTMRYDCLEDPEYPFPNASEFSRVCDGLISEGLAFHYEQPIWLGDQRYDVTVVPVRAQEEIQPIVLPYSCGRGSNFLILPAIIPFCNTSLESHFKHTVAHEFGSSTILQDSNARAPKAICDGSQRMDIMYYHESYDSSCYEVLEKRRGDAYYENGFLTEPDLQALVMNALYQDEVAWDDCGLGLGQNCTTTLGYQDCLPGLVCGEDSMCIECMADEMCPDDQYCFGIHSDLIHVTKCVDKMLGGAICNRDMECQSHSCSSELCLDVDTADT
ncbi:hypothetical protein TCAL_07793 [Tigriopus californicus]|uniref:Uncharacterized protein n=1 Tax=Tigriopus californicus TaxID=6832 RepID=A0A553PTT7_TIGCA|nr:hypothetical protein TCAL_07793 [Tigriopus californicus]